MSSKYINNIKLHQKPFDKTIAINTRSGGLYYSGYATPIQNLSLGQVAVQFGIGDIHITCIMVNNDAPLPFFGTVVNPHLLTEYKLYCVIGSQEIAVEVNSSNSWAFNLSSEQLYDLSVSEITMKIVGTDLNHNDVEITSSINITQEKLCRVPICTESKDTVMMMYTHNDISPDPVYSVTINGVQSVTVGTNELRELLSRHNIELTVFNKKEDSNGKIEPQSA